MNYRAEIDGLRALAVLSVTVFHFFSVTLSYGFNGFLGVDVFFVISGFLISQYIFKGLRNESFSFQTFYVRRVRRILPAAFFTLLFTFALSIFVLTPYDLSSYLRSQLSAIFFVPNIYFWRVGGYFGDLDALKPLLHYWSLGVEEQFYLIFPLILFFAYKFYGKKFLIFVVVSISIASFALNVLLLNMRAPNPAFFLLPTRVWEFGIGSISAYFTQIYRVRVKSSITNILLGLIVISFFLYPFKLFPLTFCIVIFTGVFLTLKHSRESIAYNILTHRFSIFIGKISFSIYLLHWPIVVFLGYIFIDKIPALYLWTSLIFLVLASYLNYKYVEVPFRYEYGEKRVFTILSILATLLILISIFGLNSKIFHLDNSELVSNLSNSRERTFQCPIYSYRTFGSTNRACVVKGEYNPSETELVITGNSHAQMYVSAISQEDHFDEILLVPLMGCLPTTKVNISAVCLNLARGNYQAIHELTSLGNIIIGMTWFSEDYYDESGVASKQDLLDDLVTMINTYESNGVNVFVISPIPTPKFNHASELSRMLKFGIIDEKDYINLSKVKYSDFYNEISIFDETLTEVLGDRYIKVYKEFCNDEYCFFGDLGGSYFEDSNHLSNYGVSLVAPYFDIVTKQN